ncbi:tRNA(Ile)-lysidine synthetase [invertebrate metagenome]|uniref:tRNA(Ile)-lysidine synthetase n=1 Tax=invertebrate metagenome TaxID=1711999 RepID=A0A484H6W7_9ZZZZ
MLPFPPPLDESTFARLMQTVGPFETRPKIAVAVSGGPDSMALCGLMVRWTRLHGGETVALTVDHQLRADSSHEAQLVGKRLVALGIRHHVLTRTGPPLQADIQARARVARYQLLEDWCQQEGALHLALAHHQDDQAETVLLRLARGSGLRGLAAMAPIVYRRHMRLVRPLLTVTRARLQATCIAYDLAWMDDPCNQDQAFSRVRIRRLLPLLAEEGIDASRLAKTSRHLLRAGIVVNKAVATLLAKHADVHPFGFAWLDTAGLVSSPHEVALRVLACLLTVVGGRIYPPRLRQLEALHEAIFAQTMQGGRTLAGCLVRPSLARGSLLLCREPYAVDTAKSVLPGKCFRWDGRFTIIISRTAPTGSKIGALGRVGWSGVTAVRPALTCLPACVGYTLPALHVPSGHIQPLLPVGEFCHEDLRGESATTMAVFAPDTPASV